MVKRATLVVLALLAGLVLAFIPAPAHADSTCEDETHFRGARFNDESAVGIDQYHTHVYARYRICYDWAKPPSRRKYVRPIGLYMRANYVGPEPYFFAQKPEFLFKTTFTSASGTTYTLSDHIKITTPEVMMVDRNMSTLARLWCPKRTKDSPYEYPKMRINVTGLYFGPNTHHAATRTLEGWE